MPSRSYSSRTLHLLSGAVFLLLLTLPLHLARADFSFDINLFRSDAVESPAGNATYLDSEEIPVSWNTALYGSEVTVMTALSPTPLSSFQTLQAKRDYLAGLNWRTLEGGLPNIGGSYTLPAGSLQPDTTHLLLVTSNWGDWDTTDGEFTVTMALPEISCEAVTEVPQLTATMQLSGGIWGTNAVWTDLTQRQPPHTSPQADDVVLVSANAGINTSATVAGLIVASGATFTGYSGYVTANGPIINYGTITQSGGNNTTTKVTQDGVYNLGTAWNNFSLKLEGGTYDGNRRTLEIMSSSPFGNTSLETNGFLKLQGCATLSGYLNLGSADIRIDEPSQITLNQAYGNPVISGSGALEIKGTATGTELGIQPDIINGPLQYLIFSGSGTQTIRLRNTTGGITAQTVRLVNGTKELVSNGTITGDLDILPTTTLRNNSSLSQILTVTGNVRNYGTITDGTANTLTVKISGSVQNNGTVSNASTQFISNTARSINGISRLTGVTTIKDSFELAGTAHFGGLTFGNGSTPAYLTFPESLPAARIEATSTLSGVGGLDSGRLLIDNNGNQLIQADLKADRIEISGSGLKRVYRQTFTGDLSVAAGATLTTWSSGWSELYVDGDVINRGTIRNRTDGSTSYRDLYMYVSGDIWNYSQSGASWTNTRTKVYWQPVTGATNYRFPIPSIRRSA